MNKAAIHLPPVRFPSLLSPGHLSIAELKPGMYGVIRSFGKLPQAQQESLRAYGILPGRPIKVIQHYPVTVIQVEYSELAFEREIASEILVTIY